MKRLILIALTFCSCWSVNIEHKQLWRLNQEFSFSQMAIRLDLRNDGYYQLIDKQKNQKQHAYFPYSFILYDDGYFGGRLYPKLWNILSQKQLRGRNLVDWGRYMIDSDSIIIQYFSNDLASAGLISATYEHAVHEGHGRIVNDSTIIIISQTFNNIADQSIKRGIHSISYDPPLEYRFVPCDSLPPSDNWLMEKEKKKKK